MAFLNDDILDAAAAYVSTSAETLYITNALATTFLEASSTYKMGSKTAPSFTGPVNGDVSGRKITVDSITDGVVDATGNASHFALCDDSESKLLAAGELESVESVTTGNVFTLTALDIEFPAAVSFQEVQEVSMTRPYAHNETAIQEAAENGDSFSASEVAITGNPPSSITVNGTEWLDQWIGTIWNELPVSVGIVTSVTGHEVTLAVTVTNTGTTLHPEVRVVVCRLNNLIAHNEDRSAPRLGSPSYFMLEYAGIFCALLSDHETHRLTGKNVLEAVVTDLHPGEQKTTTLTLRFASGTPYSFGLFQEAVDNFRNEWNEQIDWADRRPILQCTFAQNAYRTETNPSGWDSPLFKSGSVSAFSPEGVQEIADMFGRYATAIVPRAVACQAQGVICWAIEGCPSSQSWYVGAPADMFEHRITPGLTLEVMQLFSRTVRDAGIRLGLCIRPQRLKSHPDFSWAQYRPDYGDEQTMNDWAYTELRRQIEWSIENLDATIFYVDSSSMVVDSLDNRPRSPDVAMKRLSFEFPNCLIIPEHETIASYSYSAPLKNNETTPRLARHLYPKSFVCNIHQGAGTLDPTEADVITNNGDVHMANGWFTNATLTSVTDTEARRVRQFELPHPFL